MALSTQNIGLLSQLEGFGVRQVQAMNELSADEKFDRKQLEALVRTHGVEVGLPQMSVRTVRDSFDRGEQMMAASEKQGIRVLSMNDWDYPNFLRTIPDPPLLLHVKGDVKLLNERPAIAVVGSRQATDRGASAAEELGREVGGREINLVSGLARGVDGRAHAGALNANGVTTAVLAHGLDMIYPPEHQRLAARILNGGGALVSEYPIGVTPSMPTFIERNRIQAGLSEGVVVVEADLRSGTMQTARHAQRYDRLLGVYDPGAGNEIRMPEGNRQLLNEAGTFTVRPGRELLLFLQQAGIDQSQGQRLRL